MDAALFIAKMIHYDLTVADAAAWQFWATFNAGPPAGHPHRYTLVDAKSPGNIRPTKNLWVLGQYSRFIRPGMKRYEVDRSDNLNAEEAGHKLMASAYYDSQKGKLVIVVINYQREGKPIKIGLNNMDTISGVRRNPQKIKMLPYITTAAPKENLRRHDSIYSGNIFRLPPRSITTLVSSLK